jgi:hypothetical protein
MIITDVLTVYGNHRVRFQPRVKQTGEARVGGDDKGPIF